MIVDDVSDQCLECGEYFDEEHMCSHLRKVEDTGTADDQIPRPVVNAMRKLTTGTSDEDYIKSKLKQELP